MLGTKLEGNQSFGNIYGKIKNQKTVNANTRVIPKRVLSESSIENLILDSLEYF